MNNSRSDRQKTYVPQEIDDTEDRMGAVHPLDFDENEDAPVGRAGDRQAGHVYSPERVREAGMSGGETLRSGVHEDGVSADDLSPETLFDESGARGPEESSDGPEGPEQPADMTLDTVDAKRIGGGYGLDEAELAHVNPLDGKPWDGEEDSLEADLDEDELAGDAPLNSAAERTHGGRETPDKKS
nr:phosphotransferase system, HPr-related protein [uncultured Pseudomonas sp.]